MKLFGISLRISETVSRPNPPAISFTMTFWMLQSSDFCGTGEPPPTAPRRSGAMTRYPFSAKTGIYIHSVVPSTTGNRLCEVEQQLPSAGMLSRQQRFLTCRRQSDSPDPNSPDAPITWLPWESHAVIKLQGFPSRQSERLYDLPRLM